MRIKLSKSIRTELHDEILQLVRAGFKGTNDKLVEVHVKGRAPKVSWFVIRPDGARYGAGYKRTAEKYAAAHPGATLERHVQIQKAFSGVAYWGIPSIANVSKGTRYLVTLTIPTDPTVIDYPLQWGYAQYKTAPEITLNSWQEHLVHLAAHEANHIRQYKNGRPHSEIQCERWALKVLEEWRGPA